MNASADPGDVLVIYGLGSCVAVCLYDPLARVGGMLHALLPGQTWHKNGHGLPAKFVDQGVPLLIETLVALGAKPFRLTATLCGGAQMVTAPGLNDKLNIGERNALVARLVLQAAGVKRVAQAIGGYKARTVKLYLVNGQVMVKTLGQEERVVV